MRCILAILAILMGGCASTKYVPTVVDVEKAQLPEECRRAPAPFPLLGDGNGGVSKAEIARSWRLARGRYWSVRSDHEVCRKFAAAIAAK